MTPAPDIAKLAQQFVAQCEEFERGQWDEKDWPVAKKALLEHAALTKSALLAARATPQYERKSSDADRENLVIAATSARIAGFYWEGTARSVVADLRACESALALRDAETTELRARNAKLEGDCLHLSDQLATTQAELRIAVQAFKMVEQRDAEVEDLRKKLEARA